jgi:hypothetical protein
MSRTELSEAEFAELLEEVIRRLARDREADHLWRWSRRPGCADEPPGPSRRNHLAALLGLLAGAAVPGAAGAGCSETSTPAGDGGTAGDQAPADKTTGPPDSRPVVDRPRADRESAADLAGPDRPAVADLAAPDRPSPDLRPPDLRPPLDRKVLPKLDRKPCADDPCACADDPCACADDPCAA